MSESIWLWSDSKVDAFFRFILMHLNSIVPVDIRRFRELASNFGDLLLAAINHYWRLSIGRSLGVTPQISLG